jgi:hypothetical protein
LQSLLLAIATRSPSGHEFELANEIHSSSIEALQNEARAFRSEVSGALNSPLGGVLPLIVPLLTIIIKSLKKKPAAVSPVTPGAPEQK